MPCSGGILLQRQQTGNQNFTTVTGAKLETHLSPLGSSSVCCRQGSYKSLLQFGGNLGFLFGMVEQLGTLWAPFSGHRAAPWIIRHVSAPSFLCRLFVGSRRGRIDAFRHRPLTSGSRTRCASWLACPLLGASPGGKWGAGAGGGSLGPGQSWQAGAGCAVGEPVEAAVPVQS